MSLLNRPYFHDEKAAFEHLEKVLWADGIVCPHCGCMDRIYVLKGVEDKKGRVRLGLKKCGDCRKQFTVRVGTVFESAHIPLHKCLQAVYLMCASKKGISAHQLHRTLEITYKSAWFLAHRVREAMRDGQLAPFGGGGSTVEIDETFIAKKEGAKKAGGGYAHKRAVLTLVERGGRARSFHVEQTDTKTVMPIIMKNLDHETKVMTDDAGQYRYLPRVFEAHNVVRHEQGEYGRGPIHTNTIEGFFSIFKRGMKGVYQHCSEKHLHRYLAEFDFRYSHRKALGIEDEARAGKALKGITGKRLTYGGSHSTKEEEIPF
jgi:transposase-like protein